MPPNEQRELLTMEYHDLYSLWRDIRICISDASRIQDASARAETFTGMQISRRAHPRAMPQESNPEVAEQEEQDSPDSRRQKLLEAQKEKFNKKIKEFRSMDKKVQTQSPDEWFDMCND